MARRHDAPEGVLSLSVKDRAVLYAAYMPFIENGGLFVPTTAPHELGDEVFLLLQLMDEAERVPIAGRVVWITPPNAESGRVPGIGVQFSEGGDLVRERIETHLAGALQSGRPTHTV